MTDLYVPESETPEEEPVSSPQFYEVFNPDHSVGIACDENGVIVGLHIDEAVRDSTESWLAAEILRVARLAYCKSQVGLRAARAANGVLPHVLDAMGLPTKAQYIAMEVAEFGESY